MNRRSFRALFAFLTPSLLAASAQAHVRLTYPQPRYPVPEQEMGQQQKDGPCGVTNDSRVEERVTVFEPGETITVTFNETINHPGFFRISFDADGQDAFKFPTSMDEVMAENPALPVLADAIADKDGGMYSQEITLPNMECENCTLQLIQVMKAGNGPFVEADIYYQCADIALRASGGSGGAGGAGGAGGTSGTGGSAASGGAASGGSAGTGGTSSSGGSGGGGAGGAGGTFGEPNSGAGGGGAGAGGASGTSGGAGGTAGPDATAEDQGSCAVGAAPSRGLASGWVALGLLVAAHARRARRGIASRLQRRRV